MKNFLQHKKGNLLKKQQYSGEGSGEKDDDDSKTKMDLKRKTNCTNTMSTLKVDIVTILYTIKALSK